MSQTISLSHGIAGRYATALFDLANSDNATDTVAQDLGALDAALENSEDLRALIGSALYGREAQSTAMAALADKMGLSQTVKNTLGLMAQKGRLFALPQLIASFNALVADAKGEVTAEVTSAEPLSKAQSEKLAETLSATYGKGVRISETVDPAIIGGLIVKVGSKMIDSSIASKLSRLQNNMKEVG